MYSQCNPADGEQYLLLLKSIVDHKQTSKAVVKVEEYITHNSSCNRMKTTTKELLLGIKWKYGTTSWECLSNLKDTFPVEVAEYAIAAGIDDKPAFKWWMQYILSTKGTK